MQEAFGRTDLLLPRERARLRLLMSYPLAIDADTWRLPEGSAVSSVIRDQLPSYRFLHPLDRNGLGEVWKVVSPRGKTYTAQFFNQPEMEGLADALEPLRTFRHPGLAPLEIESANNHPVALYPLRDKTLKDRFKEYWTRGRPGLPPRELLHYLQQAAKTIDDLHAQKQYHLALNPRSILLQPQGVEILGWGLADRLWKRTGLPIFQFNPHYSLSEFFPVPDLRHADQASLALIYAAMVTGVLPTRRTEGTDSSPGDFDLSLLSDRERQVLSRALQLDPDQRFPSCQALVEELLETQGLLNSGEEWTPSIASLLVRPQAGSRPKVQSLEHFVSELVHLAAGDTLVQSQGSIFYKIEPGKKLEHQGAFQNSPEQLFDRLESFCKERSLSMVSQDCYHRILRVQIPTSFWQRWRYGMPGGLELEVRLGKDPMQTKEVRVHIRPVGCSHKQAVEVLQREGPRILQELRAHLHLTPEVRSAPRLALQQPVVLNPVIHGAKLTGRIEAITKDVSQNGIGLLLPHEVPTNQLYVTVPGVETLAPYAGLVKVVRKHRLPNGWYEVGAVFSLDGR